MHLSPLPATDPGIPAALETALAGGPPLAPLPEDPASTLAMLCPEEPVTEPDAALIVATSGSTGTPKGVVLSAAAIRAGVAATHERLGGPGSWTLALPAHYVAGIMVIARAVVAGTELRYADPSLADLPTARDPGYLSVVPTQLVRALERPELVERLASYRAILLGGAAADPGLLERCARAGLTVVPTYGMSETSGGCVYAGRPLPGVRVDLDPTDQRISLTGPMMFSGYRLRPDLTAETLCDAPALTAAAEEPSAPETPTGTDPHSRTVLTRDRGVWTDGRLRVLGRLDDVIVSGGVNVDLAAVERALQSRHPDAVAVGVPDPEWGTLVVAATSSPAELRTLRAKLTGLEPAARPRGLLRYSALPLTSSGKVDRQAVIADWSAEGIHRSADGTAVTQEKL